MNLVNWPRKQSHFPHCSPNFRLARLYNLSWICLQTGWTYNLKHPQSHGPIICSRSEFPIFYSFSSPVFLSRDARPSVMRLTFHLLKGKKTITKYQWLQLSKRDRDHFLLPRLKRHQVDLSESKNERWKALVGLNEKPKLVLIIFSFHVSEYMFSVIFIWRSETNTAGTL